MEEWAMVLTLLRKNPEGIPVTKIVDAIYPDNPRMERKRAYRRIKTRCETASRNGKMERLEMVYGLGYRLVR